MNNTKKKVKPISPVESLKIKNESIDDEMIEAVNNLITKSVDSSGCATIMQDKVISEYLRLTKENGKKITRDSIFERKQLDFEPIFEKAGWKVSYDKPAYNETYEAFWEFEPKKQKS